MGYMRGLHQTIKANLSAGHIGVPVYVRWIASAAETRDVLIVQMTEMIAYTNRWLATDLHRLYATGSEDQGHLSVTLEFTTGSSALLALCLAHGRPHMNLGIYGNHGAIYHYDQIAPISDANVLQSDVAHGVYMIQDAVQQSLAVHQPVELTS